MEVLLQKTAALKEERRAEFHREDGAEIGKLLGRESQRSPSPKNKDLSIKQQVCNGIKNEKSAVDMSSRQSSSFAKDPAKMSQEERLESTKAEMGEVREENERLKMILAQIVKDYQSLQMQFFDVVQQEKAKNTAEVISSTTADDEEEPELISLSLGTTSSTSPRKKEEKTKDNKGKGHEKKFEEGLTLGLDCKFVEGSTISLNESASNHSQEGSFEEQPKEEEPGEAWPPSKILKNLRNGSDDDISQQPQVKKARVSVRARCDSPTMNDGCQWRKYGQKISKGNPCPRAYYRCTVAPSCPVRKQVQRCAEDMSILITTYEGNHNHPLPFSATAMASTTSAAASMLMSGSSYSGRPDASINGPLTSSPITTAAAATLGPSNHPLHGLNFSLSSADSSSRSRPPFFLPNTSISSTPSYPTITLDLTAQPSSSSFSSTANQFSKFSSGFAAASAAPSRYPSGNVSFSSSESGFAPATSTWSSRSYLNCGAQPYNNKSSVLSSIYQSYLQKATNPSATPPAAPVPASHHSNTLTDTIAKAITSDPSFQSAIAAAITSYVGAHGSHQSGGADGHGLKLWPGDRLNTVPASFSAASSNGNACATSILNGSPAGTNSNSGEQQGSLIFLQPSLGFTSSKRSGSAASSSVDPNGENN